MSNQCAIIVGASGQDGQLLRSHLSQRHYSLVGVSRNNFNSLDSREVQKLIFKCQPNEVYYLAGFHHSSEDHVLSEADIYSKSFNSHVHGLVNFLRAIKEQSPTSRLFYASSSLIFGSQHDKVQTEDSKYSPNNPYSVSKVAGMMACQFFRQHEGVFASSGILYNHESPLRSPRFVSRKIVQAAVKIYHEGYGNLTLGNLDATVDWGYAPDYVDAMHRILQCASPRDFIVATGYGHSVREFADLAFSSLGLDYRDYVTADPAILARETLINLGDASLLRKETGWRPQTPFGDMVAIMVRAEMESARL